MAADNRKRPDICLLLLTRFDCQHLTRNMDSAGLDHQSNNDSSRGENHSKTVFRGGKALEDMHEIGMHGTLDELKELYNELAGSSYDEYCVKLGKEVGARNIAEMVNSIQQNKEARILDVGCGNGIFGKQLKELGFTNTDGLDFAQRMLDLCQSRDLYREYINASIVPGRRTPEIEDDTYDVVCLAGTMAAGHVSPSDLPELIRITKPGGAILFNITVYYDTHCTDFKENALKNRLESFVQSGMLAKWTATPQVYFGATGEEALTYVLHLP